MTKVTAPPRALTGTVAALLGMDTAAEAAPVAERVDALCRGFPRFARFGLHAGSGALDTAAVLLTGRRFDQLDADRRDEVCRTLTARPALATLVDALKMPLLLASGSAEPPPETGIVRPDPELDCTPADCWPARATADAVVIGSGAGGAMVARTLARAGLSVVIVEEGSRFGVEDFRGRPPADRFSELYRDGGATAALGAPPVLLPLGKGVGGSTLINSGTCYRPPAEVVERWRSADGIELVERFDELVPEVERTLGVAEQPTDVLGRNGELALEGARRLGWQAGPLHRNAPGCGGCCQCAVGCPRNAKNGVHLNALPQACADGARIVTELRVDRVLVDRGTAAGVAARRPDGTPVEILSPRVVVAAGATETPPLLRRSGLGGHAQLGRNLALHPATSLAGRFAEPVESWKGVLQSVGIEQWHNEGILLEATAAPPGMGTFVLPGTGRELRAEQEASAHLATLGAMIADEPSGRVHGRRRSVLSYRLSRTDHGKLRAALRAIGDVLFAAGATEVLTGLPRHPRAATPAELHAITERLARPELHLAAFHPTGSVRMGADPESSPVDERGRLRGTSGVYVADASVLPSCPTVNPQVTIMATALAIAESAVADG
ncbi:GMC family oxidoreductase [Haloechinothrix sp. YIM 98757]|uniref:GMC family oxidoreductase n=1 Tax=Haloechinothrix aidingensis TaxID=2752311 RepID=A0A838ACD3_9PSEU|nr:GMC family oxidoreductase [Haloechinothrix aidingensis]MBA0126900.1 GMC family oxidoreductase [Haloechinothrix aidingensis]